MTTTRRSISQLLSEQASLFGEQAPPFYGDASSYRGGLPATWIPYQASASTRELTEMFELANRVYRGYTVARRVTYRA
jgi:hypothetical protein